MAKTNPLGYHLSARASHPAHPILEELENRFGSRFEKFDKESLAYLIACCAALPFDAFDVFPTSTCERTDEVKDCFNLLIKLRKIDGSWVLGFIPFLYEQIGARR